MDKRDLWRKVLSRFDAVVVHSDNGRRTLVDLGVAESRLCVIPLAITPTDVPRADDGRTLLLFGVLRPYKGLPDALEVARRIDDARLVVAGDPAMPLERTSLPNVDWRLGYLGEDEVQRALGGNRRDVPVQAGLDQSAALTDRSRRRHGNCRVRRQRRRRAGPAVRGRPRLPAGDVDALEAAVRELLGDPAALEAARAGRARA